MRTLLVITVVFLAGCSQYRTLISAHGAEMADTAAEVAHYGVCKPTTAGALERRYNLFTNPTGPKAEGWLGFCFPKLDR